MSEANSIETAAQPAPAAAQPVTTGTGSTSPSIDPAEFQRLQRIEQQYRGQQEFYKAATDSGFRRPEDFRRWKPVISQVKDPEAFARAWSEPEQDEPPLTPSAISRLLDERDSAKASADAERAHYSSYDEEQAEFEDAKIAEMFKDAPKEWQAAARRMMLGHYRELRQPYEDGHPLSGRYPKTVGKDGMASIKTTTASLWKAMEDHFKAQHLAAVGDAASKPSSTSGTPAGSPQTTAKPDSKKEGTWHPDHMDNEVKAYLASKHASRG